MTNRYIYGMIVYTGMQYKNTTTNNQLITPKETLRKLSRVQDIFRELDQESREILLKFLARKYEVEL